MTMRWTREAKASAAAGVLLLIAAAAMLAGGPVEVVDGDSSSLATTLTFWSGVVYGLGVAAAIAGIALLVAAVVVARRAGP